MKYVKILGLAAMALAALMAMTGSASASTVTSPKGTTYTSTLVAESEGTTTLTSAFGGFGAISCAKSKVEGKIERHGAVLAGGKITSLTFTECTGGEVTDPVVVPGELEVSSTGAVTSKGAEVVIHKTLLGTCTFKTGAGTSIGTLTTTATTGSTATLDIKGSIPSACGAGTWEGSYKVTTPDSLYLD